MTGKIGDSIAAQGEKRLKIGLAGFCSGDNFGDLLMYAMYSKYISSKGHQCIAIGADKWFLERLHACGVEIESIAVDQISSELSACLFLGGGYMGWPDFAVPTWQLKYIKNNPYQCIARKCRASQIPYYVDGVEVGPGLYPLAGAVVRDILGSAESVVVRNSASSSYARRYGADGVRVKADVVIGNLSIMNPEYSIEGRYSEPPSRERVLGIHLASYVVGDSFLARNFADLLRVEICQFEPSKIICFTDSFTTPKTSESCIRFVDQLVAAGYVVELEMYTGVQSVLEVLNSIDFLVTTKLHAGVAALALGCYAICIGSAPKLARFYTDSGLDGHYLNHIFSSSSKKKAFIQDHFNRFSGGHQPRFDTQTIESSKSYFSEFALGL
ncbi:hypothetical protein F0M18_17205 [Pseudohalioglobus sediminis]|uniref:Polysaccharide pyruvyl transferase domain-containing protein n=1 Tax=Pseudohalioglobus sediminis TaxID=2606449 RepID=A0A5B0WPF4_9GAMM|nr:polysaccharide pyruvyl transferase family protein [Pseudohalioglobus sediminis]KAA1188940.1 hypothetical protein F0M18_17205 [Pseudohalioglobus sediminis]